MTTFVELTDEEFGLIRKGLDMLANEKIEGKNMMKELLLRQAPNAFVKAKMEGIFSEEEAKEKRELLERQDKITTIQYKLIQLRKFQAAKPGIASDAIASEN